MSDIIQCLGQRNEQERQFLLSVSYKSSYNYMYSVNPHLLSTVSFNFISSILKQVFCSKLLESFKMQDVQMKIVAMDALGVE